MANKKKFVLILNEIKVQGKSFFFLYFCAKYFNISRNNFLLDTPFKAAVKSWNLSEIRWEN